MTISALLTESGITCSVSHGDLGPWDSISLTALVYDSRRAAADTAFVCMPGARLDGHDFAQAVYDAGCRIFFAERPLPLHDDALVIVCPDTRAALPYLSDAFFGHPQRELCIIGITGTKGKTTVANLIASAANDAALPCGTIGTIGITFGDTLLPTVNSTPESYEIHRAFRMMADAGMKAVAMEVSSLALVRNRVDGIRFDIGVFTNLTEDHVSPIEHPDFEDYKNAKLRLFSMCDFALISADDPITSDVIAACRAPYQTYGFSDHADFRAENITPWKSDTALGLTFDLFCSGKTQTASLRLPGECNAHNAVCAAAVLMRLGIAEDLILPALAKATVPGRLEMVDAFDDCTVIIDYAHNEMSMRSLLETVRMYKPRRILCVYGSIGDRAQHRRRELAEVTGDLADYAIITTDNPGYEDPEAIVGEIASYYTDDMCPHTVIADRERAVLHALSMARPGDVLLFCGKGHETYQLVRGLHVPFSEKAIILQYAEEHRRRVGVLETEKVTV
ncbi:MAG: UDP-N-acetylmuramoyl-L-alanyl-D-glutamate--2,6-diaminopimelate ligase [Ruminococcaceae bacterium]|nr:UDP-N-acetylmuramoyl-L-alanyl-D-glutamate--2,6-diaminopimelate ligase [Oscillospiraceae bacterium]